MDWIEVSVSTTTQAADAVSERLMQNGAKGTQIIDRRDVPDKDDGSGFGELYGDELKENMPEDVRVVAWFASLEDMELARADVQQLKNLEDFDAGSLEFAQQAVKDEDWAENWKQYYKPMRVGKNLIIKPVWERYEPQVADLVIEMDPGMAFGTGTHETTRLCMEMAEKHYQGGRALDVGTGSGILAIALAKLGADDVVAVDIDPIAVKAATENVARNGLQNAVTVTSGDLIRDVVGSFDFVVANILADIIITLSASIKPLMREGARFLASGIIRDREQDVLAACERQGLKLTDKMAQGEWVALLYANA